MPFADEHETNNKLSTNLRITGCFQWFIPISFVPESFRMFKILHVYNIRIIQADTCVCVCVFFCDRKRAEK